jgi:hypothetical protein
MVRTLNVGFFTTLQSTVQEDRVYREKNRGDGKDPCKGGRHIRHASTVRKGSSGGLFQLGEDGIQKVATTRVLVVGIVLEVGFAFGLSLFVCLRAHVCHSVVSIVTRHAVTLDHGLGRVGKGNTVHSFIDPRLGSNGASWVDEDSQCNRFAVTGAVRSDVISLSSLDRGETMCQCLKYEGARSHGALVFLS